MSPVGHRLTILNLQQQEGKRKKEMKDGRKKEMKRKGMKEGRRRRK
jgi:hypothetical protein